VYLIGFTTEIYITHLTLESKTVTAAPLDLIAAGHVFVKNRGIEGTTAVDKNTIYLYITRLSLYL